jgi:hypothetical protein
MAETNNSPMATMIFRREKRNISMIEFFTNLIQKQVSNANAICRLIHFLRLLTKMNYTSLQAGDFILDFF